MGAGGAAAGLGDEFGGLAQSVLVEVGAVEAGPGLGEQHGGGASDAAGGAGDEGGAAGEVVRRKGHTGTVRVI
jgi:hypothetical protein